MKKLITLCIMLASAVALVTAVSVEANNPSVSYTFMLTDLEQGAGGGGSLFADGSAGGHLLVSVLNGQVIAHFYPESWSEVVPGESVDICFNTHQTKGPMIFPPYFCTSDLGIYVPVSGMPVLITNPHGGVNTLIKVTPTG